MASTIQRFLQIASDLESAGLVWNPEVGDEVAERPAHDSISILVDPQGMTPRELRETYLWLPTVEQMLGQLEARQAILFHAGFELNTPVYGYKTVIQAPFGHIESVAESFRHSIALALRDLLVGDAQRVH
jgi:hypothetical protein